MPRPLNFQFSHRLCYVRLALLGERNAKKAANTEAVKFPGYGLLIGLDIVTSGRNLPLAISR
jgi:hypothetical protein